MIGPKDIVAQAQADDRELWAAKLEAHLRNKYVGGERWISWFPHITENGAVPSRAVIKGLVAEAKLAGWQVCWDGDTNNPWFNIRPRGYEWWRRLLWWRS